MTVREDLKILIIKENITLTAVAKILSEKLNKNISADNLSQKLRKGTLRYNDVKIIADALGYEIKFEKRR